MRSVAGANTCGREGCGSGTRRRVPRRTRSSHGARRPAYPDRSGDARFRPSPLGRHGRAEPERLTCSRTAPVATVRARTRPARQRFFPQVVSRGRTVVVRPTTAVPGRPPSPESVQDGCPEPVFIHEQGPLAGHRDVVRTPGGHLRSTGVCVPRRFDARSSLWCGKAAPQNHTTARPAASLGMPS